MRSLRIAGLCLASMLVVSMELTGNAAAAGPLWLLCLQGGNASNTKYEDSACLKAHAGGEWESVTLGTKSDTVKIVAKVILVLDHKAMGGQSGVKCKESAMGITGSISGPNKLTISEIKIVAPSECERVEGACKAGELEGLEALGLPWRVEGYETEGKFEGNLLGGAGEPGWVIECNTLLGKLKDECRDVSGEPEVITLSNHVSGVELLVLGAFSGIRDSTCTQGGTKSGLLRGELAVLLPGGHGLSINSK